MYKITLNTCMYNVHILYMLYVLDACYTIMAVSKLSRLFFTVVGEIILIKRFLHAQTEGGAGAGPK